MNEIEIPVSEFILSAVSEHSRIDIAWTHSLPLSTKARAYAINSIENFIGRISKAYLPWYKNGKRAQDSNAENYTVEDMTWTLSRDDLKNYTQRLSSGILVTTAYLSGLNARLIVDGCKRCCATQNKINNGLEFPPLQVIECYGPDVASSFPLDFNPVIRKLQRT